MGLEIRVLAEHVESHILNSHYYKKGGKKNGRERRREEGERRAGNRREEARCGSLHLDSDFGSLKQEEFQVSQQYTVKSCFKTKQNKQANTWGRGIQK